MAKHTTVMATRETRCGITIRVLCGKGKGFWNRLSDSRSIGPMRMSDRVVLRSWIQDGGGGLAVQGDG